jgi:hypothetical protein
MGFELDLSQFEAATEQITRRVENNLEEAMHDAVDDLMRISSNIAPILTGTLRRSFTKEVNGQLNNLEGVVEASAVNESLRYGRFNYAIWTHEYMNSGQLGPRSRAAGGTDGYAVGNKYLTRPLHGEAAKYIEWFQEAIERGIG